MGGIFLYVIVTIVFVRLYDTGIPESEQVEQILFLSLFVDMIIPGTKAFVEREAFADIKSYFESIQMNTVSLLRRLNVFRKMCFTSNKVYNVFSQIGLGTFK